MPSPSDSLAFLYTQAWYALAIIAVYYVALFVFFRGWTRRPVIVARYEPPPGISPAVAAAIRQRGLSERAFVAALVSLSAKRVIAITQQHDGFTLRKLHHSYEALSPEEQLIVDSLFHSGSDTCSFNSLEYSALSNAFAEFDEALADLVDPEFLSNHRPYWYVGLACSLMPMVPLADSLLTIRGITSIASMAYVGLWIALGGSCLVAATHVWPVTLHKLASYLPWMPGPKRPVEVTDPVPLFLSAAALLGFIFLSVLTSTQFALLLAAVVLLNSIFRRQLETPTRRGHQVLEELDNFREFLSRADTDRLNRENEPGNTPDQLEKYSAYAVALEVENSWGEELFDDLTSLLQMSEAYTRRPLWHSIRDIVIQARASRH